MKNNNSTEYIDSLQKYMSEAGKYSLLSKAEERQLFEEIELASRGGRYSKRNASRAKKARETLINSNLRLVIKIANQYRHVGLDFADLINEGNIGLMTAIDKFDLDKGAKLSYYASFWIKQSIRRAISNKGRTIRLPVATVEAKLKIHKFIDTFELNNDDLPSYGEVSKGTGIPVKKIKELLVLNFQSESLNIKIGDNKEEMEGLITNEKALSPFLLFSEKDEHEILGNFLRNLDERQRYIIIHRFGLNGSKPQTLEVIGKKFNLTRERIRQLELVALRGLREMYKKINKNKVYE